jgi:hypothetical protein
MNLGLTGLDAIDISVRSILVPSIPAVRPLQLLVLLPLWSKTQKRGSSRLKLVHSCLRYVNCRPIWFSVITGLANLNDAG